MPRVSSSSSPSRSGGGGSRSSSRPRSSSHSRSSARTRSPSAADQVGVRYPDGVYTVIRPSDYDSSAISQVQPNYDPSVFPKCDQYLKAAVEGMLFEGTEKFWTTFFSKALRSYCGIELDVGSSENGLSKNDSSKNGSSKNGSTSSRLVQD